MIDEDNQSIKYGSDYPKDQVSGYTLKQLEQALIGAKAWDDWRKNIESLYENPTKQYLEELFNNWKD